MINGLAMATAKRSWYVPNVNIWGTKGWSDFDLLILEEIDSDNIVTFDRVNLGEGSQEIKFAQLTDFRGNSLPATIKNAKVFINPKSDDNCFLIGEASDSKFKIARSSDSPGSVTADLYILEFN